MVNLDQDDHMLENGNARLREQVMSPRERGHQQQVNAVQDRQFAFANEPANVVAENRRQEYHQRQEGGNIDPRTEEHFPTGDSAIPTTTSRWT